MIKIPPSFFVSQDPPALEHIIENKGFKRVIQSIDWSIKSKKGKLVLLIGTRGIGKSTCLFYSKKYVDQKLNYDCSRYLDLGLSIQNFYQKTFEERNTSVLNEIANCLSDGNTNDITEVIKKLNNQRNSPFFLFIDNLDRQYQTDDDLKFVKYFFQTSDPILKALSKRVVIFISCAPEWKEFLSQQDLSYLNFPNSIKLEALTKNEIKDLIEKRAGSIGIDASKFIDMEIIPTLKVASRGNPRSIFQFLEKIFLSIDEHDYPINNKIFRSVLKTELYGASLEKLSEIASASPKISWGINQLYRFFDALQKGGVSSTIVINKLVTAHEKGFIEESEVYNIIFAWKKISHKKDSRWFLNPQVRETITEWGQQTKVDKDVLLTAFSDKPFMISTSDVESYFEKFNGGVLHYGYKISDMLNDSYEKYIYINSMDNLDIYRREILEFGWECIEKLMITFLAMESGYIYPFSYCERGDDDFNEKNADEIIRSISQIFTEVGKTNRYESDIFSIKLRYKEIKNDTTIIPHLSTEQIDAYKKHVLTSYEGLLMSLNPDDLKNTTKSQFIKNVKRMISGGENSVVEFKSSLRWDYNQNKKNSELEKPVLKNIVAFLNTKGGSILIGVDDKGKVLGIENDMLTLSKNSFDGFHQHLINQISDKIGVHQTHHIAIKSCIIYRKIIAIIEIEKAAYPAYLKEGERNIFYMRAGNTSRELSGEELQNYLEETFE